jgi:hypothetical protein
MNANFLQYCEAVGLSNIQIPRVTQIYTEYGQIINQEIRDIFISEQTTPENAKLYISLWFFSDSHFMEAKNFLTTDDFDIAILKKRVKYVHFTKANFVFGQAATNASSFALDLQLSDLVNAQLRASQNNCVKLLDMYKKHILPNIIT